MNFQDDNHALTVGMFVGFLMRNGIDARPGVDRDGNYTDTVGVEMDVPGGEVILVEVRVLP